LFLPMIILTPILPIFSEIQATGDHRRFSKVLGKNLKLIWLLTLPLVVLVCCLSKTIISLLYGSQYSAAFVPACIMLFTALLMVINSAAGTGIISSSERVWHGFGLNLFWFLTFAGSSYFLIPLQGALGLSLAFILSYVIFSFVVWLYSVSVMKTEYPRLSGIIVLTIISAVVSLGISVFLEGGWNLLGGVILVALLIAMQWKLFLRTDEKVLLLDKFNEYRLKWAIGDRGKNAML